ncbi:manganese efflux pump [Tichowtungia aerotolerans]|uniref:Putative manganese efflux pump MntP n=1 Tax=Tichowtungia aerotolerans TaxID=2697043 RepID=A0A6P1MC23_9BACT|nr:manganese efflux pump [Tichowtungia aerotolerans]QHI68645.1 ZIP family metal transporter [Tichowtungia aerotolerans]
MPLLSILLIALGLAMDAFAVSITSGITIKNLKARHALLVGAAFGLFQAGMPLLGWAIGRWAYDLLSTVDYWIAFGLLLFVGGHMIIQALQPDDEDGPKDPLHLPTLLTLAVATSIDAFAIGISLSMLRVAILTPVLLIGLVTFVLSFAGVYFGRYFGHFNEKKMEVTGGLVLIGLGTKMLIERLIENQELFQSSETVWFAFGLTLAAGMATGIGSLLALFTRKSSTRRASLLFGLSTGLLLWTAFRALLPIAEQDLANPRLATVIFFGGFLISALIDRLVPDFGNPHEPMLIEELKDNPDFRRTGMPAALAIAAHSFPEGLAVFIAALHAPAPVAVAAAAGLALHNIPEGISTALPMFHATGSRSKACVFSSLTGLAEPLGALLVYTLVYRFLDKQALGVLSAAGAGIMVFIALDGLLPAAHVFGKYHYAVLGTVLGMLIAAALSVL